MGGGGQACACGEWKPRTCACRAPPGRVSSCPRVPADRQGRGRCIHVCSSNCGGALDAAASSPACGAACTAHGPQRCSPCAQNPPALPVAGSCTRPASIQAAGRQCDWCTATAAGFVGRYFRKACVATTTARLAVSAWQHRCSQARTHLGPKHPHECAHNTSLENRDNRKPSPKYCVRLHTVKDWMCSRAVAVARCVGAPV